MRVRSLFDTVDKMRDFGKEWVVVGVNVTFFVVISRSSSRQDQPDFMSQRRSRLTGRKE